MSNFFIGIFILLFCFFFLENILNFYTKNIHKVFLDKPNLRSMHKIPKPTGGGILILTTSLVSYFIWNYTSDFINSNGLVFKILLISTPLSIISFYDDLKNISQRFRYFIQLLTGFFLLINSELIQLVRLDLNFFIFLFLIALLAIFITGIINITNFMDGIDGLVVGSFSIIFLALTFKFDLNLFLISFILLCFLKWNWQPAAIFMGDSGSTLLGSIFAGILINTQTYYDFLSIICLYIPLLIDSSTCLIWRFWNGYNIFNAHKMHLYQRLVLGGLSHEKVALIYLGSISFISIFYLINNLLLEFLAVCITFLFGIYLHLKVASPLYEK